MSEEELFQRYEKQASRFDNEVLELDKSNECKCCGQNFTILFDKGQPIFKIKNYLENFKKELVDPESCINQDIVEKKVSFPSGHLLMADWFRIPEFTEIVEQKGHKKEDSISHDKGILRTIEHHLGFGVISVNIGNSSPNVFERDGSFVFGEIPFEHSDISEEDYEICEDRLNSEYNNKGSICTDLWNATIIDKQNLIELLTPKLGDSATQTVDNYIKKNRVIEVQVEPGDYTLKFHANYTKFAEKLEGEDISDLIKPYFLLKKGAPKPVAKPKM